MIAMLMSGMFVCALLGRFWQRFNWQGALASLVSASLTSLVIILNSDWSNYWGNPIIPSVIVSIVTGTVISKITPQCQVSAQQALAILDQERSAMEGGSQQRDESNTSGSKELSQ